MDEDHPQQLPADYGRSPCWSLGTAGEAAFDFKWLLRSPSFTFAGIEQLMALPKASPGVVVKNTFLEVGDHQSLMERSDTWRRHISEPAKIYTTGGQSGGVDAFSELDESDEDDAGGPVRTTVSATAAFMGSAEGLQAGSFLQSAFASGQGQSGPQVPGGLGAAGLLQPPSPSAQSAGLPAQKAPSETSNNPAVPGRLPPNSSASRIDLKEAKAKESHINNIKDIDITKQEPPWANVTTVMMRNLPNKYSQTMILEELGDAGFNLQTDFDFFYLPMDHSNAANLGYCFINFVETARANAFASSFAGKRMRKFNSSKTVAVMPASVQGYDKNFAYYSSTRVAQSGDPQYRPIFMRVPGSKPETVAMATSASANASASVPQVEAKGSSKLKGQGKGGHAKGERLAKGYSGGNYGAPHQVSPAQTGQSPGDEASRSGEMGSRAEWRRLRMMAGQQAMPAPAQVPLAPAPASQAKVCFSCGSDVGTNHRFCAFCGSDQLQATGGSSSSTGGCPAQAFFAGAAAPYSLAGVTAGLQTGAIPQLLGANQSMIRPMDGLVPGLFQAWPSLPEAQVALNPMWQTAGMVKSGGVSVTDEMDVMRGRLVLLAALKEMEEQQAQLGGSGIGRTLLSP